MIRRMAASFHMPFETLHQGKRSAWEESRYHPQFINLICYAPFRPAGGGIVTVILLAFSELGAHTGTPWGHGESMQTPHRNALSPTPPKVWAPMTWRSRHITQCPQCPLRESNPERSCCEAAMLPLRHCAPPSLILKKKN